MRSYGLIRREGAPPPIATTLFHVTEAGADLLPVLDAIGRWGARYMIEPAQAGGVHHRPFGIRAFLGVRQRLV